MNIIHCIGDEKFIDGVIEVFDRFQGTHTNRYVFFPENKVGKTFQFLKHHADQVVTVDRHKALSYIHEMPCDVMVMHNISTFPVEDMAKIDRRIKVVWLAWGYDLYASIKGHCPFIPITQYRPLTQQALDRDWFNRIRMFAKRTRWHLLSYGRMLEEGVARVDYFSGVIPWEYDMMTRNSFFHARQADFTYFSLKPESADEHEQSVNTNGNILLGNSAGNTNNHIDVLEQLSHYDLGGRKVYVPLSYAGRKHYIREVIKAGRKYMGDHFVPMNTFIPLPEYQKIIASCGYAIFAIERQQALSNIWMAIDNGLTIFLSSSSPLFQHLRQQGYHLFTTQDDLHLIAEGHHISAEEARENHQVMLKYDSQERHIQKIKDFYRFLEGETA